MLEYFKITVWVRPTLDSGINVGPKFNYSDFFPGTTALSKGPMFIEFIMKNQKNVFLSVFSLERPQVFAKFSIPYGYSRPNVYSFCQIFQPYVYSGV